MAGSGLTGAHCLDMNSPDTLELLTAIEQETDLPLKLRISPWCTPNFCEENLPELAAVLGQHGRRWKVEGIKLMVDGTIDNGTAWLAEPDTNGESTAGLWLDPAQYSASVAYFHGEGVSTATHAIGDAAVEHVLNTLVALEPSAGTVHRLEHVETIPDELVEPFAAQGIAASMQPTHCTHFTRADQSDNWSRRLGPHRAANGYRTRDLRDAGALLAIGSDWPIADYDPRLIIADAQLRRPALQPDVPPVGPGQRLTALQALEGYTSHAAASIGCNDSGRIRVGAPADLTVFSLDPLASDPDDFAASVVLATIVEGEVVHRDSSVRLGRAGLPVRSKGL
jgi:predicted amidohydrolase YtcJ